MCFSETSRTLLLGLLVVKVAIVVVLVAVVRFGVPFAVLSGCVNGFVIVSIHTTKAGINLILVEHIHVIWDYPSETTRVDSYSVDRPVVIAVDPGGM